MFHGLFFGFRPLLNATFSASVSEYYYKSQWLAARNRAISFSARKMAEYSPLTIAGSNSKVGDFLKVDTAVRRYYDGTVGKNELLGIARNARGTLSDKQVDDQDYCAAYDDLIEGLSQAKLMPESFVADGEEVALVNQAITYTTVSILLVSAGTGMGVTMLPGIGLMLNRLNRWQNEWQSILIRGLGVSAHAECPFKSQCKDLGEWTLGIHADKGTDLTVAADVATTVLIGACVPLPAEGLKSFNAVYAPTKAKIKNWLQQLVAYFGSGSEPLPPGLDANEVEALSFAVMKTVLMGQCIAGGGITVTVQEVGAYLKWAARIATTNNLREMESHPDGVVSLELSQKFLALTMGTVLYPPDQSRSSFARAAIKAGLVTHREWMKADYGPCPTDISFSRTAWLKTERMYKKTAAAL